MRTSPRALRVKRLNLADGKEDLEVAELLHKKGQAHLYKNEFARAKATFDAAVQIHKKKSMEDCIPLADSTCCLGVACFYMNDFSHAKLLFQECMRIQEKLVGDNDLCIVHSLCWLGRQQQKVNEPQKALERYLSALQICKKNKASVDYRLVVMLLHAIGKLYESDNVSLRGTTSELQQHPNLPPVPDPSRSNTKHQNASTTIDAQKIRKDYIRVLQRIDSNIVDVAKIAAQVALYEYNNGNQTSQAKKNGEGSLFITKQSDTPNMKLAMLNRSSKVILEVPITASFRLQLTSPYLMFRENPASNGIRGIMFHDRNESDEIASYLEKVVKQEISLKCEWNFSNMAFQFFTRVMNFHLFISTT